jgi:cytokinin dehydrogenase
MLQDALILEGLQYRRLLLVEDDATVDYAARYDARFRAMRQSGAWEQAHPWFECMLPFDAAQTFISETLNLLPPFFGDGHRVIMLADTDSSNQFMRPAAPAVIFAILPTGIPEAQLPEALEVLATLNKRLVQCGGKRYLSGWLDNPTGQFWQTHFGEQYEHWRAIKQASDPNQILRSVLFP